jgi:hypothetical protein
MIWDRDKWLAVVNKIMNLCIPYNAGNFLTGRGLCSMEIILFYGMRACTKAYRAGRLISERVKPAVGAVIDVQFYRVAKPLPRQASDLQQKLLWQQGSVATYPRCCRTALCVILMILSPILDRFSLKMEALRSFETSATVYLSALCHIPEDLNLLGFHCCVFVTQHFSLNSENIHGGNHDGRRAHCHRNVREDSILR